MQSITEVDQLEDDMTKSLTLDDNKTTIYKVDESFTNWIHVRLNVKKISISCLILRLT